MAAQFKGKASAVGGLIGGLQAHLLSLVRRFARLRGDQLAQRYDLTGLEEVRIDDIMTPRGDIEGINIEDPPHIVLARLEAINHRYIPVYEHELGNIVGLLMQQNVLHVLLAGETLSETVLRRECTTPYFIASSTRLFEQLEHFRSNRQRLAFVVDEYGEILGLVTINDIIDEIADKLSPVASGESANGWNADGEAWVDGSISLRDMNRRFNLDLPLFGAKTLNGLILEHLQDIPEVGTSLRLQGLALEIMQAEDRRIKRVKLYRPPTISEANKL